MSKDSSTHSYKIVQYRCMGAPIRKKTFLGIKSRLISANIYPSNDLSHIKKIASESWFYELTVHGLHVFLFNTDPKLLGI